MGEPKPDPGNAGPDQWSGEPVDDAELIERALAGEFDDGDDDE